MDNYTSSDGNIHYRGCDSIEDKIAYVKWALNRCIYTLHSYALPTSSRALFSMMAKSYRHELLKLNKMRIHKGGQVN